MASKSVGSAILDTIDVGLGVLEYGLSGPARDTVRSVRRHAPAAVSVIARAVKLAKGDDAQASALLEAALTGMDAAQLARQVERDARVARKPRRPR